MNALWDLRRQYLHAFIATACVLPILSYVLTDMGWSAADIGVATASMMLSGLLSAQAWGWLDDRLHGSAAAIAFIGSSAATIVIAAAVTTSTHWLVWGAVALYGACASSLEPLLTTRVLRNPSTAAQLGVIRAAGSVGWILGLLLAAAALTISANPIWVFAIAAIATATAPRRYTQSRVRRTGAALARVPVRTVLGVVSITFAVPLSISTLVAFTAGWAHGLLGAGPFASIGPLALAAALEPPGFAIADKFPHGRGPLFLVTMALPPLAVSWALLALIPGELVLFLIQPLVATSFAFWNVGQAKLVAARVQPDRLASAQTLVSVLTRGVAGPLAGIAGGALASAAGYRTLFVTMTAVSGGAAVRGFWIWRREYRSSVMEAARVAS